VLLTLFEHAEATADSGAGDPGTAERNADDALRSAHVVPHAVAQI